MFVQSCGWSCCRNPTLSKKKQKNLNWYIHAIKTSTFKQIWFPTKHVSKSHQFDLWVKQWISFMSLRILWAWNIVYDMACFIIKTLWWLISDWLILYIYDWHFIPDLERVLPTFCFQYWRKKQTLVDPTEQCYNTVMQCGAPVMLFKVFRLFAVSGTFLLTTGPLMHCNGTNKNIWHLLFSTSDLLIIYSLSGPLFQIYSPLNASPVPSLCVWLETFMLALWLRTWVILVSHLNTVTVGFLQQLHL